MRKHLSLTLAMVLLLSLVISACDLLPQPATDAFRVGMVTDVGGIDDRSFNATAWRGIELAEEQLNVEGDFLESTAQPDYAPNITHYINQGYDLIVTVGFLLADDTREFAVANPDFNFAIVDVAYDPPVENIRGLTFATDEAAFLAGYAAAAATQTGIVATFGGINIPPVSIFMVGFEYGVMYYNQQNNADVQVLGWNTAANTGVFVGNFDSTDDGRRVADEFLSEGADIIMPVAGPVGLGSAEAVQQAGNAWIIGVDTDWTVSAPEYASIILTSVLKNMDVAVFDTIQMASESGFTGFGGETYLGTLQNDGVGIAPIASGAVTADVENDLNQIRQGIINGEIDTGWAAYIGGLN